VNTVWFMLWLLQENLAASSRGDFRGEHKHESIGDVSGQTAPAAFSLLSLHNASQLWPNSAPEMLTIEQLNPTDSNPTSYCEVSSVFVLSPV